MYLVITSSSSHAHIVTGDIVLQAIQIISYTISYGSCSQGDDDTTFTQLPPTFCIWVEYLIISNAMA